MEFLRGKQPLADAVLAGCDGAKGRIRKESKRIVLMSVTDGRVLLRRVYVRLSPSLQSILERRAGRDAVSAGRRALARSPFEGESLTVVTTGSLRIIGESTRAGKASPKPHERRSPEAIRMTVFSR